ncbi:hypothetical protein Hanom_Chr04g00313431 [Helianthus anomalus]
MEEKFGQKDSDSSDSDDDGDNEGGDGGDAGAEDTKSDDNQPEPGYEFYVDEHGVRQAKKIRREDDDDDDEYVPSDTEAERLKKKQTVFC